LLIELDRRDDRGHFIASGGDGFASKNRQLCA
jgi:hypothetical protein